VTQGCLQLEALVGQGFDDEMEFLAKSLVDPVLLVARMNLP